MSERTLHKIAVDLTSGTWFDADNIVIIDVTDEQIEELDQYTDSEISEFAFLENLFYRKYVILRDLDELKKKLTINQYGSDNNFRGYDDE